MWMLGIILFFESFLVAGTRLLYHARAGFELDQNVTGLWYALVVAVVGVLAIRWFKAAVLEGLLAAIPIAIFVAGSLSDRVDFLDRFFVASAAVFCAISLVGFAIRVVEMPEHGTSHR
jgi:hypothetical protein